MLSDRVPLHRFLLPTAVHHIVRETIFVLKQRTVPPSADLSILDFPLQHPVELKHQVR